jgi:hypothetical protein
MRQHKANKFNRELGSIIKNPTEVKNKIQEVMELFNISNWQHIQNGQGKYCP